MKWSIALVAAVGLVGCVSPRTEPDLAVATERFIQDYHAQRPLTGVALGWHQFDGQFVVPTAAQVERERAFFRAAERQFPAAALAGAEPALRRDLALVRRQIETELMQLDGFRADRRNPMTYVGALDVSIYLKRDWKPLDDRVQNLTAILRRAPELFAVARAQLESTLPKPWVETAIQMADGTATFLEKDVAAVVQGASRREAVGEFAVANTRAVRELREFSAWLKAERLPRADDRFALGEAWFARMLRSELVDLTPAEVLALGLRELKLEQDRFAAAARVIDPTQPAMAVFKRVQAEHPTEQSLLPDTRRNLGAIRQFVVDRQLVTIPSEVRAKVEATLPPFRATSFASMDTPGPFETRATEAIYYVTPTEPEWSAQQKDEWLTAFNYYTTDVVSIHEAYPGHYVQFLALNASPASTAAKVFGSYAFIEGWAHYTEQMLLEAGFAGPEPLAKPPTAADHVRAAKYQLAQSSEALLRLCRLCCAVKLHCQGMSVNEATRFFVENAYYENQPARSEAIRGTFDPGYCFYTLGKLEILKLRADVQAAEGAAFSLKSFHDRLLSQGAPPVRVLREVLLGRGTK